MKKINRNPFINNLRSSLKSRNRYEYNRDKSKADALCGYTGVVTGAGIEFGYSTALALLRSGAEVIAAVDFPYNALKKYSDEKDFDLWKDRLYLYELDFKEYDEIIKFIKYTKDEFKSIDIIINCASQSSARSREYYIEMEKTEKLYEIETAEKKLDYNMIKSDKDDSWIKENIYSRLNLQDTDSYNMFVRVNRFMKMQTINNTLPYLMITELKGSLLKSVHKNKFIINVIPVNTAFKENQIIYSNMVRASLNELTKSFEDSLSKDNILIYSIDTGVSVEESMEDFNDRKNKNDELSVVFDEAAVKICRPIFKNLNKNNIKDFEKAAHQMKANNL